MAQPPSTMSDDDLARPGRTWFAEIREKDRAKMKAARLGGDADAAEEAGTRLLDWLFADGGAMAVGRIAGIEAALLPFRWR